MDVGYTDENAEQRPILGGRGKAGVDRLGVILCFYVAGIGTVLGEKRGFHSIYCLQRGDVAVFRNNEQLGEGRRQEADKVEVGLRVDGGSPFDGVSGGGRMEDLVQEAGNLMFEE